MGTRTRGISRGEYYILRVFIADMLARKRSEFGYMMTDRRVNMVTANQILSLLNPYLSRLARRYPTPFPHIPFCERLSDKTRMGVGLMSSVGLS